MNTIQDSNLTTSGAALMWFRRDLRHIDNAALFFALQQSQIVYCVFVFDTTILNALPNKQDRRVEFIWESLKELKQALIELGGDLFIRHGEAEQEIPDLAKTLGVRAVFTNRDYEPHARARDQHVEQTLRQNGIAFCTYKDHVIFEQSEILTQNKTTYSVFSPYKKAWLARLTANELNPFNSEHLACHQFAKPKQILPFPSLEELGFEATSLKTFIQPGMRGAQLAWNEFLPRIKNYHTKRDFPGVRGVSYLSVHNRFGTLSIRTLAQQAYLQMQTGCEGALACLNELIWRDFYFQILWHHPQVLTQSFKPEYDQIRWEKDPIEQSRFNAWCQGQTGYPLVDAAMRQLNQTGYQHNRLRMVTASFLCKSLGVNWRKGEQYFTEHLNDFDLAANNGGWQWASSSGCDAQPYFRIFNPITQSEKFDSQGEFIRKYCPELKLLSNKTIHTPWLCSLEELKAAKIQLGQTYPWPIVDHAQARQLTLERYAVLKQTPPEPL